MYVHDFFFLLKNKIATLIPGRLSAAFTAVAAGAVPSIHVKDMQHEGTRTLYPLPLIYSRARVFKGGKCKAEHEMAGHQVFVVPKIFSSCSPVLLLQL